MSSHGGTGFIAGKNGLSLSQETPGRGILSEPLRLEGLVGYQWVHCLRCSFMIIRRNIGLVAAVCVCLVASSLGAKEFTWKLEPGKTYEQIVEQEMTTTVPGGPMGALEIKVKMEVTGEWKVLDRDSDGNMTIEARVKRMKLQMNGPQGNVTVDTDDKESLQTPVGQQLGGLIAKFQKLVVTQKMNPQGKIIESKITSPDGEDGLPMLPGISSDELKKVMAGGDTPLVFPKKDLKPGDSWTQEKTTPIPGLGGGLKMEQKVKYVGTDTDSGRPLDRFDAEITLKPSEENQQAKIDGSGKSTAYFNTKKGFAEKTEAEITATITQNLFGQESVVSLRMRTVATIAEKK